MAAQSKAGGAIGDWIETHLNCGRVTNEKYMGQSSWATSHRYETDSGQRFFVKVARGTDGTMFKGEALGLQSKYDTHTLRIPRIYHHGELSTLPAARDEHGSFIIMEFLDFGGRGESAYSLGAGLAKMHLAEPTDERAQRGQYGFAVDNTIGGTPQRNGWMDDWVSFFAERRLKPQLQQTSNPGLQRKGDKLIQHLGSFFEGIQVKPALLHGDLWSGNMTTVADGGWAILDPAVYYGHSEAEFGMSWCAGFSSDFWRGYHDVIPQAAGFKDRHQIYTLYHYLNHYNLFGGGYLSSCENILNSLTRRF